MSTSGFQPDNPQKDFVEPSPGAKVAKVFGINLITGEPYEEEVYVDPIVHAGRRLSDKEVRELAVNSIKPDKET